MMQCSVHIMQSNSTASASAPNSGIITCATDSLRECARLAHYTLCSALRQVV
jgi:hypothetical protein